jgi:hypothetical protein
LASQALTCQKQKLKTGLDGSHAFQSCFCFASLPGRQPKEIPMWTAQFRRGVILIPGILVMLIIARLVPLEWAPVTESPDVGLLSARDRSGLALLTSLLFGCAAAMLTVASGWLLLGDPAKNLLVLRGSKDRPASLPCQQRAEGISRSGDKRRQPTPIAKTLVENPQPAAPPSQSPGMSIKSSQERLYSVENEVVRGSLLIEFEPHQQVTRGHVSFVPPLADVPNVTARCSDSANIQLQSIPLIYGIRFEARRAGSLDKAGSCTVYYEATAAVTIDPSLPS